MTDYNFLDDGSLKEPSSRRSEPSPISEPEIELPPEDISLIKTGRKLGVLSLSTGEMHPILQRAAQFQARFQARHTEMGHFHWGERSKVLFAGLPELFGFREVVAYTGYAQAADSIFESWRNSPDHWVWVNGQCDFWGYAMASDRRASMFYACGIFADRRKK